MCSETASAIPGDWKWPDSLDALIAAPAHHRLLFENASVRVLNTCIPVGETTPLHTHRWPSAAYIESWSDFVRRDDQGNVLLDTRGAPVPAPGSALWSEPFPPHTLENVGDSELRVITVEVKSKC
jgi:hypothetical protein